jgi:hypothetical protein
LDARVIEPAEKRPTSTQFLPAAVQRSYEGNRTTVCRFAEFDTVDRLPLRKHSGMSGAVIDKLARYRRRFVDLLHFLSPTVLDDFGSERA